MPSQLFQPLTLRGLTFPNRIAIASMCQYSAVDGSATDWHTLHLGSLSVSGAGLLMIEATGVEAGGGITPGCLGLYSDGNEAALAPAPAACPTARGALGFFPGAKGAPRPPPLPPCRKWGNMPIGIQLAHAGRKASSHV